jgi:hypothetical protein
MGSYPHNFDVNEHFPTDRIKLWNVQNGKELVTIKGRWARFSPDSRFLYVGYREDEMVWDIKAGKERVPFASVSARPVISADNIAESADGNKWNWTVFIKGDRDKIDEIKCVEYTLHPTFPDPVRKVCDRGNPQQAFALSVTGWGTFTIGIRVFMKDGSVENLKHQLKF